MNVTAWVAIAGAVIAFLSAVVSGLTVYLTGRRETRKWLRESLLEAQVQFLDASFDHPSHELYDYLAEFPAAWAVGEEIDVTRYVAQYGKAHESQNDALTRIRLLADESAVRAAEELHWVDKEMTQRLLEEDGLPRGEEFREMRMEQKQARERFIRAARQAVNLPAGAPIRHTSLGEGRSTLRPKRPSVVVPDDLTPGT
ncbi:hypothetical protein [Blastococcus sp. SYSU D01042]